MKSTILILKNNEFRDLGNSTCGCVIDLLPAYAINYTEFNIDGIVNTEGSHYKLDIENSKLIILYDYATFIKCASNDNNMLYIYYFGIRDYSLLFPKIKNEDTSKRLGNFYEEAEICFENKAWLSYSLMCAAIFEGILFNKYKDDKNLYENKNTSNKEEVTFYKLIKHAYVSKDINKTTKKIMDKTRMTRNLVHINNYLNNYVSRIDAMDIRTTMDNLIKNFIY